VSEAFRYPWDTTPAASPLSPDDARPQKARRRGRRPASLPRAGTTSDWLYHHLTIGGPATGLQQFAAAARGSGVTPWQLDYAAIEEDVFVRAISQPASRRHLTVEGCRILAREFRQRVEMRQARASELVGHSFVCPFDLHALRPVPSAILQLGPTHPDGVAWLAAHWGITDRLRQVVVRERATTGRRLPRGHAVIGYGFFTDGETPHAAVGNFEKRWPALRFWLVPRPAD
jgi:hypothetical protein